MCMPQTFFSLSLRRQQSDALGSPDRGEAMPEGVPLKDVVGQHTQRPHVHRECSHAASPLPRCGDRLRAMHCLVSRTLTMSRPPHHRSHKCNLLMPCLSKDLTVLKKQFLVTRLQT